MQPSSDIARLLEIMSALRTPGTGCPWDLEQDFASIAPYTVEEAHEVADAIARHDLDDLRDELGDLLLQVVFHSRMAEEEGAFSFADVVQAITEKMIRRHPHVFGTPEEKDPAAVKATWDEIKKWEKARRAALRGEQSSEPLLDDVPPSLPALMQAVKLQKKAAKVGFDWPEPREVLQKIREEIDEIEAEIELGDRRAAGEELGDLLFAVANLARHLDADPDQALRATNAKFRRRFGHIEARARETGEELASVPLDRQEGWWQEAKRLEGDQPSTSAPKRRSNSGSL
ncbi:nucleoside triphosphate pyrophosphohydrolase [Lutibaculum baratangense]|uniref:nucleoside triphosphate pyrophosphohydrolase n=1 Tax=Lutibaculum baratangense TaxID=1358440 RepID=UPI000687ADB3|nr:nucleoside triphosphate pyrophosphohydrolase [Lutibaculum baratangense]